MHKGEPDIVCAGLELVRGECFDVRSQTPSREKVVCAVILKGETSPLGDVSFRSLLE